MNTKQLLEFLVANGGTTVQKLLATNMDVAGLRNNGTLRDDEWKQLDEAIIRAFNERLVGYQDLISGGLTFTIANGLGTTILESENVSDFRDAQVSMAGVTRGENDAVNFELVGLPLPIIHKDYQLDIRKLAASRNRGESLDVTQAALASRKVAEKQEDMLFNGENSFSFGGQTIFGYTDFPERNTVTLAKDWVSVATGVEIVADVRAMKQSLIDKRRFGPYNLYIPGNFETRLDDDYDTTRGNTIRQRIEAIAGIQSVKVADKLTASNVIMSQMTEDNIRAVIGLDLTNVEWEMQGGMTTHFKVMTITIPQLRTDQDLRSGVSHLS